MEKEQKQYYADFLKYVAGAIVSNPGEVSVSVSESLNPGYDKPMLTLVLRVHDSDVGKVIGAKGETIAALRRLMKCLHDAPHVNVAVDDPRKPRAATAMSEVDRAIEEASRA